eukprot:1380691-Amorphochlora_amoeboformis.AAC.1
MDKVSPEYNYVVTAHRPTAVTHALTCSFTGRVRGREEDENARVESNRFFPWKRVRQFFMDMNIYHTKSLKLFLETVIPRWNNFVKF